SNPMEPKLISTSAAGWASSHGSTYGQGPVLVFQPLPVPGLTPRQRLEMLLAQQQEGTWALEGDILTMAYAGPLTTYRLSELTPQFARFDRVGIYSAPLLQQFFGDGHSACRAANGLVYESIPANRSAFGGSRITVFDVRNRAHPQPVAHFAVPNGNSTLVTCPLPDGRALIGGERLYLVGPPPRW
ncbi:MAG TPA: hypothetical protein VN541_00890, partial [Tepidisphaeraceae bacterium]|nr:hypothetical protein [Tepidisphaeraceae bacterium]